MVEKKIIKGSNGIEIEVSIPSKELIEITTIENKNSPRHQAYEIFKKLQGDYSK